jgi:hypothetical protein
MASVTHLNVENDLINHLLSNLPSGFTASLVKLPNAKFTTPTSSKWMRATVISPVVIDVDASQCYKTYRGLFVVDLFYPKGSGSAAALTAAQSVIDSYTKVSFAYSVSIDSNILVLGEEENWYHVQINSDYLFSSYTAE